MLFISCSITKQDITKHNYFNKNIFCNDSINVEIDFWGGLEQINFLKSKKTYLNKGLSSIKHPDIDNLFISANSTINKYNISLFFEKTKDFEKNCFQKIIFEDTIKNYSVFIKKQGYKKITGIVNCTKSIKTLKNTPNITNKKYSSILANRLLKLITIDSINKNKFSSQNIFDNYTNIPGNFLEAREKLKNVPLIVKDANNSHIQYLNTVNSFMSNNIDYDINMIEYEKKRKNHYDKIIDTIIQKKEVFKNKELFNEIAKIADENRLIILNEDHYYPKHRVLAMKLLNVLKQKGYNYLSLEAFEKDSINSFIPNIKNGFYINEPYFAHFIRKAKDLGFKIIGHENTDNTIDREAGQAKNIYKILEKNSQAKILVYVGHSHLEKENSKKKWMAQYIKELYNINPITINQAAIFSNIKEELILIPREYLKDDSKTISSADYFLINNLKVSLNEIYPDKVFKDVEIVNKEFRKEELLVDVFDWEEHNKNKTAIPILSELQKPLKQKIKLNLPVGKYFIIVKSEDDERFVFNQVDVK